MSVTALLRAAAIAAAMLLGAAAHAQTVLRSNLPAGDATPTGASFSVQMPVAYSDVELQATDPSNPTLVVRMVTGASKDGVKFSASEIRFLPGVERKPLEDFMKGLKANPFAALVDVRLDRSGGRETLSFLLIDIAAGGNFFDVVRTDQAQYTLTVQFHRAQRDEAAAAKDGFFNSFKLTSR